MRGLVLFALVALTADAGRFDRINSRCAGGRSSRGLSCDDLAFFEFAPASGAGMTAACACTTPTGAKGEVMTFTRTGDATCSRQGLATTGIANGDLVVCTANQPRVESSGGVLGLRVEGARTNLTIRSDEINNAAWADATVIAAAPALNAANAAVAPDGTMTAEDYTFPATAAVEGSFRLGSTIAVTCNAAVCTHTVFVKGVSGSGTMDICSWDTATPTCQACSFVDASWTRCAITTTEGGNVATAIGNGSVYNGGTARSSNRVYVWGAGAEAATYATSYIPTVAVAVTRNAETATLPVALSTGSDFSIAESFVSPNTTATCAGFFPVTATTGPNIYTCFNTTNVFRVTSVASADSTSAAFSLFKWQTGIRWGGSWNRATSISTAYTDGVAGTPSAATPGVTSVSWTAIGLSGDGIHSLICADPSTSRCR